MHEELKKTGAALVLFTRLPWHRLFHVESHHFAQAAAYWPFAGWITGSVLGLTFWLANQYLPTNMAAMLAIAARMLLTGALHEDGLADYCDGMGGGRNREHTLRIMKDSHIGTYGVLGLIVYLILFQQAFTFVSENIQNDLTYILRLTLTADISAKCSASLLTAMLPYARTAEEAKTGTVYAPLTRMHAMRLLVALLPVFAIFCIKDCNMASFLIPCFTLILSFATTSLLALQMRHRLQGYTGDCCGATFLLSEFAIYTLFCIFFAFY